MSPLAHSVLVTGSNRGIGLGMVQQLVEMTVPPEHIFATCRNPAGTKAKALRDLADKHSRIHVVQLDVDDQSSVKASVAVVESHLNGKGLNLLINNAGVFSLASLETVQPEEMLSVFNTNVVGPILVVKEYLPLLQKAARETATEGMSCKKAAIINITSSTSSFGRGFASVMHSLLPYCSSKAALNMVTVCMARELKGAGILCTAIYPGWVKTDMAGEQAPLTVQCSVMGILKVLANLSSLDTGAFLDWEGNRVPCVLVTGSSRGIGFGMVQQLVEMTVPPEHIFATCRNPAGPKAKALRDLADKHSRIHVVQLDVDDQSSVKASVAVVESHLNGKGLNLLINNAGVFSLTSLETVQPEEMLSVFNTNVVGPILVVKEYLPLLKKVARETTTEGMSCKKAAIINITSRLSSFGRGFEVVMNSVLPYRASKVALNMVTVCMARELKGAGILCTAIHPGWVKTDMAREKAPLTVQCSVTGILQVLANLSSSDTGAFLDWEGNRFPW